MDKTAILTLISAVLGSGVVTAAVNYFFNRKKTAAEAKAVVATSDNSVLNTQNDLLEKLLERSQRLVNENEKLQKEYGNMLLENAQLRAEIVQHIGTISTLQKDTRAMRIEVQAIMQRVKEIDVYLEKMYESGSNSHPFADKLGS